MAIYINHKYKTEEDMMKHMNEFREALQGSPAYASGEIVLCSLSNLEFVLCVGIDNAKNIHIDGNHTD